MSAELELLPPFRTSTYWKHEGFDAQLDRPRRGSQLHVVESCTATRWMPCWRMGKTQFRDMMARATHWPWIRISAKLPSQLWTVRYIIVWYIWAMQRCLSIESSHPWDHWTLNQALLLSPLAVAMAVAKEGWLLKRGPSVESAWLPQWCVLASALRSWHSKHWQGLKDRASRGLSRHGTAIFEHILSFSLFLVLWTCSSPKAWRGLFYGYSGRYPPERAWSCDLCPLNIEKWGYFFNVYK